MRQSIRSALGSHHNRQAREGGHRARWKQDRGGKLGLAFLLACPACAGGFFLAIGAAFGATALALKGFALAGLLTLVIGLWARNAWDRRTEDAACAVELAKEPVVPAGSRSR